VQGDLNRRERREIRKVIETINRMMRGFVHGKLNAMAAGTRGLQNLKTIDSMEIEMSYERQVMVARQSHAVSTSGIALGIIDFRIRVPITPDGAFDGLINGFKGFRETGGRKAPHLDEFNHNLFAGPEDLFFHSPFFHCANLSKT